MDIQKENDKYLVSLVTNCGATQDEINDLNFDDETGFFESNRLADWFINQINFGWRVWQAAKAQSDKKIKLLLCDEHLQKCESPTGVFNSQYPDEEPCLICLAKEAKAQAVPEWISVEDQMPPVDETVLVCWDYAPDIEPDKEYTTIDENLDEYWPNCPDEPPTHWMPMPKIPTQEPTND